MTSRDGAGALHYRDRPALFSSLEQRQYDLIVIGAGITGAGIARSAAQRGLAVALVEARDVAAGTSSRSSKMIHGGLRYLAQGDVGLVREAASERQILRRIAPHLARRSPFLLPVRSLAGLTKFRAAMWAFEKLGQVPEDERHEVWTARETASREPVAAPDGVTGAVLYYEFLTDDARLTLANVRSARAAGADVVTYAPVVGIRVEDGRATGVRCQGALPGENLGAEIRGRVVVNAAGPWVDALRALEADGEPPRLSLTKGIHLVVPHERLPISRTVLMNAADRRPVFAVPRGEVTYIGTTDTFFPRTDYWPEIGPEDVDYLFEAVDRSFRIDPLKRPDVVASWTGVRPLIDQQGKTPSEISRRDEVWTGPAGVLSIAGGKLTAYRTMAVRVVDRVVERLGGSRGPEVSDQQPLVGGDVDPEALALRLAAKFGEPAARRLVSLYGSEALQVASDGADLAAEVRQAVRREGALRLEDYWVRRGARAWFERDGGLSTLEPASIEMAQELGWDEATRQDQVEACRSLHEKSNALFH
ncbi:MAG: FAD-dependent oxidoreductase [Myxococcota bacterium]